MMYLKFQKLLITGCRNMDKKRQKCPKYFMQKTVPEIFKDGPTDSRETNDGQTGKGEY